MLGRTTFLFLRGLYKLVLLRLLCKWQRLGSLGDVPNTLIVYQPFVFPVRKDLFRRKTAK